ncbi:MAG: Asd/ArgC dimerization domain-containing protein [Endozoicomonas sp. (ex Botrylloides leachii)]|nr:Asd/ArgC dimerization domain-containing protein [Endozoicomonas sp. (ex Botrylloides leachii)]
MSRTYDIAVCDSTSLGGETLIRLLEEKRFPIGRFYPLSDLADSGSSVKFFGEDLDVTTESAFECTDVDLVFIPCASTVKESFLQQAMAAECMVIDGSKGAAAVPGSLVVLSAKDEELLDHAFVKKRVVIPSSPAAIALSVLHTINDIVAIERIDITAFQSVASGGNAGIDELRKQTIDLLNGKPVQSNIFPDRIAYNLIPQLGSIDDRGITHEEVMIETEICSGLNITGLDIRSTSVVAPVFYGECLSVTLDTEYAVAISALIDALSDTVRVNIFQGSEYPTLEHAVGADKVMIGRLRAIPGRENAISFWLVADGDRQGALSMISVAERLIRYFL